MVKARIKMVMVEIQEEVDGIEKYLRGKFNSDWPFKMLEGVVLKIISKLLG